MRKLFFGLLFFYVISFVQAKELNEFKLDNGLTVYLWEDKNQADVSGRIVVRAGSIDEPEEFTGLAHYLEHVLFKGTKKIGALNWEKEKPHYEEVIKLYDELATSTDPILKDTLIQKINRASLEAAKHAITSDFSNLIEGMGGKGLNAGTSYDMTYYLNNFPTFQIEKWLDIYSERLINPVFRSFQAELENVFEEYNMYQDDRSTHERNFLFSKIYPTHPYGRDIIGKPEHLKKPRLSKLIEFYNTWYVPENMALVLVGNFDSESIIPMIKEKFGRLEKKSIPERKKYEQADFSESPKFVAKLGYAPTLYLAYQGVPKGHKDEIALNICTQLLSNSMSTGLLDKLSLDGDVSYASAMNDVRRDDGRLLIVAAPYYDISQRIYESDKATEKLVMNEVDKLKNGIIDDWRLNSVINEMLRQHDLVMETPSAKMSVLTSAFAYNEPLSNFFDMNNKIMSITKEEIQRVAKQYFSGGRIVVSIEEGKPKKDKIKKPNIKPIEQPKNQKTEYARYLQNIPVTPVAELYNNLSDVKVIEMYDGVKLHYTENKQNNIFTLLIRYGVGTKKMPKLEYAVPLMNSAGIMPNDDAQSVRRQFSELNIRSSFSVDDDYFYIYLNGDENNLSEACKLLSRQILLPKLDDKQLQKIKGRELSSRLYIENSDIETLSNAALEYALYKDSSEYINRMKFSEVYHAKLTELTGDIIRATDYNADLHYVGKTAENELANLLKNSLPLKANVKMSTSPNIRETITYSKPTIYFLPNAEAQQAKIYFYINGSEYKTEDKVKYDAFYQYFSGGFNGLVMNEIRENNSMAYTAYGALITPPIPDKKAYFLGYVGTQPDKVSGALDIYLKLLQDMPVYPERIENIKSYLKQVALSNKPSFRTKSIVYESWKRLGYSDDPAKVNMGKIDKLTFDEIMDFYNKEIKEKPITIVIVGDPKLIDTKTIGKTHGKVTKIAKSSLFSKIDL